MRVRATAPGKAILLGEHGVVYGNSCLALAIDLHSVIEADFSDRFTVNGYAIDRAHHVFLDEALDMLYRGEDEMKDESRRPLSFATSSQIPSASNLGSSSALTVCCVASLFVIMGEEATEERIAQTSYEVEFGVQGVGSPMDTSTITHGGLVFSSPRRESDKVLWEVGTMEEDKRWVMHEVERSSIPKVVIGYTQTKARTMEQVLRVKRFVEGSEFAREVIREIDELARKGYKALKDGDMETFGKLMNKDHELLSILGVNTLELQRLVDATRESSYGSKITGSGGGGSIIALSDEPQETAAAIEKAGGVGYVLDVEAEGCKIEW